MSYILHLCYKKKCVKIRSTPRIIIRASHIHFMNSALAQKKLCLRLKFFIIADLHPLVLAQIHHDNKSQQGNFLEATLLQIANLTQDALSIAAALTSTGIRHDAVVAEVVATTQMAGCKAARLNFNELRNLLTATIRSMRAACCETASRRRSLPASTRPSGWTFSARLRRRSPCRSRQR